MASILSFAAIAATLLVASTPTDAALLPTSRLRSYKYTPAAGGCNLKNGGYLSAGKNCTMQSSAFHTNGTAYSTPFKFVVEHTNCEEVKALAFTRQTLKFWRDPVSNTAGLQTVIPRKSSNAAVAFYVTDMDGARLGPLSDFTLNVDALGSTRFFSQTSSTVELTEGSWTKNAGSSVDFVVTSNTITDKSTGWAQPGTSNSTSSNAAGSVNIVGNAANNKVRLNFDGAQLNDDAIRWIPALTVVSNPLFDVTAKLNNQRTFSRGRMEVTVALTADTIESGFSFAKTTGNAVVAPNFTFSKRGAVAAAGCVCSAKTGSQVTAIVCTFASHPHQYRFFTETVNVTAVKTAMRNYKLLWIPAALTVGTFEVIAASETDTFTQSIKPSDSKSIPASSSNSAAASDSTSASVHLSDSASVAISSSSSIVDTSSESIADSSSKSVQISTSASVHLSDSASVAISSSDTESISLKSTDTSSIAISSSSSESIADSSSNSVHLSTSASVKSTGSASDSVSLKSTDTGSIVTSDSQSVSTTGSGSESVMTTASASLIASSSASSTVSSSESVATASESFSSTGGFPFHPFLDAAPSHSMTVAIGTLVAVIASLTLVMS